MPIAATDLVWMLSTTAGSAGATTAQASRDASLGKYVSTTAMGSGAGSLFDDITGAENAASTVDYRCIFLQNNHSTLTASLLRVYIASEQAGGANIAIGLDPVGITAKGASAAQAAQIANEITAPSGVSFSAPTTDGTGLAIASLAPNQVFALWVRRSATNSAALANDNVNFGLAFDTPA